MEFLQRFYRTKFIIVIVIALSLLATPAFASQLGTKRSELTSVKNRIATNRQERLAAAKRESEVLREVRANDRKIVELQNALDESKAQLDNKIAERGRVEFKLAGMEKELVALREKLASTERKLAQKQEIFDNRITAIYKKGSSGTLEVILSSSDLGDLFRRLGFIEIITRNDAQLVAELQSAREIAAGHRDKLAAEQQAVTEERRALLEQEDRIRKARKRIAVKYELFRNELKRQEKMLAVIEREKNRLEITEDMLESSSRLVASQIRTLENGGTLSESYGRMVSGVGFIRPCSGRITSKFGWRRHPVLGYSRLHAGVDFGVASGTPIHAAQSGTIIMAGRMGGYGKAVVISHGGSVSTLYGHNSKLRVSVGQKVSRGDVIASSGSTGLSTGPHLHFEVRVSGTPKNPMNWID